MGDAKHQISADPMRSTWRRYDHCRMHSLGIVDGIFRYFLLSHLSTRQKKALNMQTQAVRQPPGPIYNLYMCVWVSCNCASVQLHLHVEKYIHRNAPVCVHLYLLYCMQLTSHTGTRVYAHTHCMYSHRYRSHTTCCENREGWQGRSGNEGEAPTEEALAPA
jgi:hypothetical protein